MQQVLCSITRNRVADTHECSFARSLVKSLVSLVFCHAATYNVQ
jgi:hypothetical protein